MPELAPIAAPTAWMARLHSAYRDLRKRYRLGKAVRWRRRTGARIFAVTGSSGKSTTVALLSHILAGREPVKTQVLANTANALYRTFKTLPPEAKSIVMELGIAQKGDMAQMAAIVAPDVAIVTLIGREHYSAFRGREGVAEEKVKLVEAVPADGLVILNADDDLAAAMTSRSRARVVTFGRSQPADYRVMRVGGAFPGTLTVDIEWKGGAVSLATGFPGEQFWLSTAAAFAAAVEHGVAPGLIAERVASFRPHYNRAGVYRAPGGPIFMIDTAKAPNDTLGLAFDMVRRATAVRKRIVLGQISDYPGNPRSIYARAYTAAARAADEIIFVGDNAHRSRASEADRESGRFREFATPQEVAAHIRETAIPGELILLKSANNLHLERLALQFAGEVRCWEMACRRKDDCLTCGLYAIPFDAQPARVRAFRRARRLARFLPWKEAPTPWPRIKLP